MNPPAAPIVFKPLPPLPVKPVIKHPVKEKKIVKDLSVINEEETFREDPPSDKVKKESPFNQKEKKKFNSVFGDFMNTTKHLVIIIQ